MCTSFLVLGSIPMTDDCKVQLAHISAHIATDTSEWQGAHG